MQSILALMYSCLVWLVNSRDYFLMPILAVFVFACAVQLIKYFVFRGVDYD